MLQAVKQDDFWLNYCSLFQEEKISSKRATMTYPIDSNSVFSHFDYGIKKARGPVRTVENGNFLLTPEKTEKEKQLNASAIPVSRELTAEEEKRVIYLQNLLSQILTMVDGQPTDEQKARIKEIEKELTKITGIKMHSSVSNMADKMPARKDDEEEKEKQQMQYTGIDPKDAIHSTMSHSSTQKGPGVMQFIQKNAIQAYLKESSTDSPLHSAHSKFEPSYPSDFAGISKESGNNSSMVHATTSPVSQVE